MSPLKETLRQKLVFDCTDALAFTQGTISDPPVHAIARKGKVSITTSAPRDTVYPGVRGADVLIRTKDASYGREVLYPKGEPEYPLSLEELIGKYETNAGLAFPAELRKNLRESIMNVDQLHVDDVTRLLRIQSRVE